MSSSPSPFLPRVFSRPTGDDLARLTRSSSILNEDYEARRSAMGPVFTAPTSIPIHLAPLKSHEDYSGSRTDEEIQCDESSASQGTDGTALVRDASVLHNPANHDPHGPHKETQKVDLLLAGLSQLYEAEFSSDNFSLTNIESSNTNNVLPPADDSDLEWDQPGAFDFLANIETDNFENSDNDTRSSGYTEFSPLRPRRLYETALINRATHGCSSLRESAVWSDDEDITDLSSITDANDLSQYHADLEDELEGNNTDDDDDDSDYEYSSACSTLSASDESDDEDFLDAWSDSEHSEEI